MQADSRSSFGILRKKPDMINTQVGNENVRYGMIRPHRLLFSPMFANRTNSGINTQ